MAIFFVTGIGTGIGKTIISAILVKALQADYWKPVQAGTVDTDSDAIRKISGQKGNSIIHPEVYKLALPASPHISAREEGINISIAEILRKKPAGKATLIIEGPGGLMVPLNDHEFVIDLIKALDAKVILVSRNYLGSINHSLLTAGVCRHHKLNVEGWVFNDDFGNYEDEIVNWTGYKKIGSIPFMHEINGDFISEQSLHLKENLADYLC